MKRLLLFTLLIIVMFSAAACSHKNESTAEQADVPATTVTSETDDENDSQDEETDVSPLPPELSNTGYDWYFRRNDEHKAPQIDDKVRELLADTGAFYILPGEQNDMYLTFDCGYELGYATAILDTLKANNVRAAFFITGHYLQSQPELVKRMYDEGHLICSHTWSHPDLSTVTEEELENDLRRLNDGFFKLIGEPIKPYLRPPMGRYSQQSLYLTRAAGYRSVFWSIAFNDWDPNRQPGAEFAYQHLMDNIHPGAVILLHIVSESDTEALNAIINGLKNEGYRFSTFE